MAGAEELALAPQITARLALRGAPPSYSDVFAAVNNAQVDALAEVRALVPGAILPLSNLIRVMMAKADHGGGAAAMDPFAAPPPTGSAPALADGRARTSSGRFARTRSPDAPPSADDTSTGSTNADGRADGAPRPPVAVQTPDAAALGLAAAAAAAARAADIDAASMRISAALCAAPGPRRTPAQDTPWLKRTVEFTALCKLASTTDPKGLSWCCLLWSLGLAFPAAQLLALQQEVQR